MPIDEPYITHSDNSIIPPCVDNRDNFGPIIVPKNSLFVMGNARDISNDSRHYGFVGMKSVIGRVLYICWSWDKINKDIRPNRIGQTILEGEF